MVTRKFQIQENCISCQWRTRNFFCSFNESILSNFQAVKVTHLYERGSVLFSEGQPARGVYMVCAGRVKLSTYSEDGKALIVRIAEPGEILGISANVSDIHHEATARAIDYCQINFVKRSDFMALVRDNGDVAQRALRQMSRNYQRAHQQACSLGLSASVRAKVAKLFLEWSGRKPAAGRTSRMALPYTHEEIAEMIGTSRETVTRVINDFRRSNIIVLNNRDLYIPDLETLKLATNGRHSNGSPR